MSNVFSLFYQSLKDVYFAFSLQVATDASPTPDHLYSRVQKHIKVHGWGKGPRQGERIILPSIFPSTL